MASLTTPVWLAAQTSNPFQGSVVAGEVSAQPVNLTLDDAIERGLRNNLGVILSGTQTAAVRGQRLSQLQALGGVIGGTAEWLEEGSIGGFFQGRPEKLPLELL